MSAAFRSADGTPASADLVVVGAGVMGAWIALRALECGRRTILVDAYGAGHPRATSGDENRISRASHGADRLYARWSRESRTAWIEAGESWGERLFVQAGCLWFGSRETGFEAASEEALHELRIPVERLSAQEVRARWPQIAISDDEFGLFEPEAGLLHARAAVRAVVAAFERAGGSFKLATVEPGRIAGGRLIDVVAADGRTIGGDAFVFAGGPWLPRIFPDLLSALIRVTKQDVVYFGTPGGDARWSAEATPCWVDYDASFYGIPGTDGRGFKVGPDRYGPVFDPTAGERVVDPDSVRLARRYLERRFPALADQPVVETRVCQYETTPDTHFVIDRHPGLANAWIVGGGSGHGFKHGPRIAQHVLSRLEGVEPTADERRFSIERPRELQPGMRTSGDSIVSGWEGY